MGRKCKSYIQEVCTLITCVESACASASND
jgi:hypothetical protein